MSKVRKGKQIAAVVMAVALSAAMVTTGVLPNTEVHVHAEEDGSVYKKIADSSVDGFYYEQNVWGYIQCTTDKTLEYSSYDEMIKKLSAITKKIVQENAYDRYSFSFPIKISSAAKDERFENDQVNKDLENEVYKEETGDPKGGHTMASMGGGLTNIYDITYSESEKAYIGEVTGSGGYGSKKDRYDQAVKKLNEVIKNLNLDGKSDYEKFKAVTNWIVSNVRYDDDNETKYQHDLTGAVLDGLAVCDGYAGTFYYMANAVGLNALFEDGITNSNRIRHAWNLVEIDGTYYYVDPTNAYFKEDGEPGKELLPGQKYLFSLYTPDNTTIEDTYKNISQDDWLKEHSICKGNHNLRENGGKSAQCTTPATIHYECTNPGCLYGYDVESSPALGHAWNEGKITQEQSCDNPEITTYTCTRSNCKKKKHVETKPALGHTWDEGKITKEAICSETGVKTYTCSRCGGTKTEEIPKTKHDYEEHVETPATCTSKGISYYVCKNCGRTTSRYQTPKKDHTPEIRNKKEATCKAEGYTGDTYCTDCGELIKKGSATEKADHNWEVTSEEKATCEKDGSKTFACTECGETKTETTPKTGHKFSNWKTVKAQSIYSGAVQKRTCNSCGKKETKIVGDKLKPVLKVNAQKLQLKRGQKTQKFTLIDIAKGDSVKSWVSSNKKIVTVSGKPNGTCIIKAGKKTGSAKITITMRSNLKKTIGVKVQKKAVACTSIKNVPKKLNLKRKKSYQMKPVINPITCTYKAKCKTSNKKIVKVTSRGKITAVKKGKAKITVMVGKKKFVCTVTVR